MRAVEPRRAARLAGGYPADFAYPACPVDGTLADGDAVRVGGCDLEGVATPGHAAGHLAYVLRRGRAGAARSSAGDAFFFGGRILLQHTWDCSVQESIRSVRAPGGPSLDGLYPGHLTFSRARRPAPAGAGPRAHLPPGAAAAADLTGFG